MTTAIATRPMAALADMLDRQKDTIAKVAERGTDMERLFGLVRFQLSQDRGLLSVLDNREGVISVVRATTKLAQLGLEPTGKHGGAYLVKYGNTVQVLPDWRSYRDAAIEAGAAKDIYAVAIHANDQYEYGVEGGRERFFHKVDPFAPRGDRKGWMFIAILPDNTPAYLPVTMEQISKRREQGNRGTWNKWPDEMERKTVIRMGCDQRLSVRSNRKLADLMAADDAAEVGVDAAGTDPIDVDLAPEPQKRTSALKAKLTNGGGVIATLDAEVRAAAEELEVTDAEHTPLVVDVPEATSDVAPVQAEVPDHKGPVAVVCPQCESTDWSRIPTRVSKAGDVICVAPGHGKNGYRFFRLKSDTKEQWSAELGLVPTEFLDGVQAAVKAALVPDVEATWSEEHAERAFAAIKKVVGAQQDAQPAEGDGEQLPGW